jgi:TolB-like protein
MDARHPPSGGPSGSVAPVPGHLDRLDSWKAVATFLRRDVRTVQRWEATEGLPVYRQHHSKQGSIYAYKSEIEAWWDARQSVPKQGHPETDQSQGRGRISLDISYPQLAIYAALIIVLSLSIAVAKQMFQSHQPASAIAGHPQRSTIAVLPFQGLSNTSEDATIAYSITISVTTDFIHSRALRVIDHSLVMPFEGSTDSPEHIARLLHSDKLLRGTAGYSGNSLRVAAELVDPVTGDTIWSRQYERAGTNLPKIENEIASTIATDVENNLGHDDRSQQ